MKKTTLLPTLAALLLASCSTSGTNSQSDSSIPSSEEEETSSSSPTESEQENEIQLFDDPHFETGLVLKSTSTSDAHVVRDLNYEGKAEPRDRTIWQMAQWWSPFDFQDAPYSFEDGFHVYQDESRTLRVNTETGELDMQLNSWLEYQERFGGSRVDVSQTWSHFLIEQNFSQSVLLSELSSLNLSFGFEISDVTMYDEEHYNPSVHAAQFIMYFTIRNTEFDNFFWFGVPLFDNRGNEGKPSYNIDSGFEGATNALIYRMGQNDFLPNGVEVGNKYTVNVDLIPFIQDAMIIGTTVTNNPPLAGWDWNNCYIDYMNAGWELPGSFNIESSFTDLSLLAVR